MVTQGVDPGSVGEVGDTWLEAGNDLASFQDDFAKALADSETTWTGSNADAARKSVAQLGNSGGQIGQAAQFAGVLTHRQSQALATAKNSMPAPPAHPFDPTTAQQQLNQITDPAQLATQAAADHAAAAQQQQAHQQAARVVHEYDTTVAQVSNTMPAFAPAPQVVKHDPAQPPSGTSTPVGTTVPHSTSTSPREERNTGLVSSLPDTRTSTSNPPMAPRTTGPQPSLPPQLTSTSDYTGPNQPSANPYNDPYGQQPRGGTPNAPFDGGQMFGPVGGGNLGGLGSDTERPGGGFGPGSGGGGRAGGLGGGSEGSGGPGGRSGAGGAGARSGAGAAAAEESAIAKGAAGARGAGASGGMAPGARGGKKGEDSEHKRASYLVEDDPDSIFGTDEKTAPPVIG